MGDQELIAVGRVVTTHGLRGEMRIQLYNPDSTSIQPDEDIILRRGNEESTHRVVAVRPHKRVLLVTLEGYDSIDASEGLIGCDVCVPKADLPPVGDDEVYHFDLLGMDVFTTGGENLGSVAEIMPLGSHDVCVVRLGKREYLIPMIADVIRQIDRDNRRLVVEPLPGLLD
jgi:16S rRNA processing protein RimM